MAGAPADQQWWQQAHATTRHGPFWVPHRLRLPGSGRVVRPPSHLLACAPGLGLACTSSPADPGCRLLQVTTEAFRRLFEELPGSCDYNINDRTAPDAVFACDGPQHAPAVAAALGS
jgi:hypothetical protein